MTDLFHPPRLSNCRPFWRPGNSVPSWTVLVVCLVVALSGLGCARANATELMAKNGMILQGQLGSSPAWPRTRWHPMSRPAVWTSSRSCCLDDGLRRTYLSWLQIQDDSLRESDGTGDEKIRIRQNVATGSRRVGSVTSILHVGDFDPWGRRTFSLLTPRGRVDLVQGITEITPVYTRLEGLAGSPSIQWDSRIATSSLPRETLSRLLRNQSSADDPDARLKIVRLLFSAERYQDARIELEQAMREFPELAELQDLLTQLRQYVAQRLIDEIRLRKAAGQHSQVQAFLAAFPEEGVATETLLQVRELQREYEQNRRQDRDGCVKTARRLAELLADPRPRAEAEAVCQEIDHQLNVNNLARLADIQRLADDPNLPDENKLALVISGWVLGARVGDAEPCRGAEPRSRAGTRDRVLARRIVRMGCRNSLPGWARKKAGHRSELPRSWSR